MRAGGRACFDERLAVLEVRADRGGHNARGLRQRGDRVAILAVGDHERPVDAELCARLFELGLGAAAECDPNVRWSALGEVLGRQHADEAGCSVDDDVVFTCGICHARNLTRQSTIATTRAGAPLAPAMRSGKHAT